MFLNFLSIFTLIQGLFFFYFNSYSQPENNYTKLYLAGTKSIALGHSVHFYAWGTLQGCCLIDVLLNASLSLAGVHFISKWSRAPPPLENITTTETSSVRLCAFIYIHVRDAGLFVPGEKVTAADSTSTGGKLQPFNLGGMDRGGNGGTDGGVNFCTLAYNV